MNKEAPKDAPSPLGPNAKLSAESYDEKFERIQKRQSQTTDPKITKPNCTLCGEPMPNGEEMFMYHGYSGPCPKPPLPKIDTKKRLAELLELSRIKCTRRWQGEDYPMNETGLGIEATAHLREILVLIEEAQKYV